MLYFFYLSLQYNFSNYKYSKFVLISKIQTLAYMLGIWELSESTEYLLSLLSAQTKASLLDKEYKAESRLKEKAATRVLLNMLLEKNVDLGYLSSGKPFLKNSPQNISISHTHTHVAIILADSDRLGIDIESVSDRVQRIRSRFISAEEYIDPNNEVEHLLVHWSAKETMYKALGKEGLTLKTDLLLNHFNLANSGVIVGNEVFTLDKCSFEIQYFITEHYVLTFTV